MPISTSKTSLAFKSVGILIVFLLKSLMVIAQDDPDLLYKEARDQAFEKKDYPRAISLARQALAIDSNYADIRVFLGSLYAWNEQPDSARLHFRKVLTAAPGHEDASVAYSSLEFWNKNNDQALKIVNAALIHTPRSERLLLLKTKVLMAQNSNKEANDALKVLLKINPGNTEGRALSSHPTFSAFRNQLGITYQYLKYQKQFDDPWHLTSIDFTRYTGVGPVTARVYRANRFNTSGYQYEIESYPRISANTYAYIGGAYSEKTGIFPEYRAGLSLFRTLPAAFEVEAGVRMLDFGEATWMYTAALGKYYKNFWFNLRGFVNPTRDNRTLSAIFNTRYYFRGKDDFLSFVLGSGISPDNQANNFLYRDENLKAWNIGVGFQKALKERNILHLGIGLIDQEYLADTRDTQFELSLGYRFRF